VEDKRVNRLGRERRCEQEGLVEEAGREVGINASSG
jgi:hypothetical protein